MKVGDLVTWGDFIGVIAEYVEHQPGNGWLYRVYWADGGQSVMYTDEIEVTHPSIEVISENR
tara:strand:- start:1110 stop:1295 length:186 start_codon:yes stop_codon:yes gene_type:complete